MRMSGSTLLWVLANLTLSYYRMNENEKVREQEAWV